MFISSSIEDTKRLAMEFSKSLEKGDVILLNGSLGAGKTLFAKIIINQLLGIAEENISSPSFTICNIYYPNINNATMQSYSKSSEANLYHKPLEVSQIYHYDFYRIENEEEAINCGLVDSLNDKNAINIIEWPERVENLLPDKVKIIDFEFSSEDSTNKRVINIEIYDHII